MQSLQNPNYIEIIFKKPHPNYNTCLYYEAYNKTWSDEGCIANNINDEILICQCKHLTDFTISNFNPKNRT